MKIVVNRCYGGFGLSHEACLHYAKLAGFKLYPFINGRDTKGNLIAHTFVPYTGKEKLCPIFIYYSKKRLVKGKCDEKAGWYDGNLKRDDPILVRVVEALKKKADGQYAKLEVVEIPDGIKWEISEYDGVESVDEVHRSW